MSLILDAINKSEQERPRPDTVPGVQTLHEGAVGAEQASRWRRLVWPLVAIVLALLVIALWFTRSAPPVVKEAPQAPAVPVAAAQITQSSPVVSAPKPVVTEAPAVSQPPVATPPGIYTSADVVALYAKKDSAKAAVPKPSVSESEAAALDVEAIALAAQQALAEKPFVPVELEVEDEAPFIAELSQRVKDEIPSIYFTVHHWSTVASEREVTLNGTIHREGDRIKAGLTLVAILKDSIVLDYRGTEFQLRSLNSWVNL
jgi:general secretion pathway protein B